MNLAGRNWLSIAVIAISVRRLAEVLRPRLGRDYFLYLTLIILPVSIGSLRAGQMNVMLAATLTLAAADVMDRRWWRATFWLGLALALKPQALVFLLLLGVFVPQMRRRTAVAILGALLVPFLVQRPGYVIDQYRIYASKLVITGQPGNVGVHYNDIFGLFWAWGVELSEHSRWLIRMAGVPITLGLSWFAVRRQPMIPTVIALFALSSCYLMFFNPHNEGGSYVIAAMPLAAYHLLGYGERATPGAGLDAGCNRTWLDGQL